MKGHFNILRGGFLQEEVGDIRSDVFKEMGIRKSNKRETTICMKPFLGFFSGGSDRDLQAIEG
jgi:hypothetical protein